MIFTEKTCKYNGRICKTNWRLVLYFLVNLLMTIAQYYSLRKISQGLKNYDLF